jgi:hypothetical protein
VSQSISNQSPYKPTVCLDFPSTRFVIVRIGVHDQAFADDAGCAEFADVDVAGRYAELQKWPPALIASGALQSSFSSMWNPCLPGDRPVRRASTRITLSFLMKVTVQAISAPDSVRERRLPDDR